MKRVNLIPHTCTCTCTKSTMKELIAIIEILNYESRLFMGGLRKRGDSILKLMSSVMSCYKSVYSCRTNNEFLS